MTALTVYIGLNVEVYHPAGRQAFTLPLLPLTPVIACYYQARALASEAQQQAARLVESAITAAKVVSIGLSVFRWAMIGV